MQVKASVPEKLKVASDCGKFYLVPVPKRDGAVEFRRRDSPQEPYALQAERKEGSCHLHLKNVCQRMDFSRGVCVWGGGARCIQSKQNPRYREQRLVADTPILATNGFSHLRLRVALVTASCHGLLFNQERHRSYDSEGEFFSRAEERGMWVTLYLRTDCCSLERTLRPCTVHTLALFACARNHIVGGCSQLDCSA